MRRLIEPLRDESPTWIEIRLRCPFILLELSNLSSGGIAITSWLRSRTAKPCHHKAAVLVSLDHTNTEIGEKRTFSSEKAKHDIFCRIKKKKI
jgi:hypothetical protein